MLICDYQYHNNTQSYKKFRNKILLCFSLRKVFWQKSTNNVSNSYCYQWDINLSARYILFRQQLLFFWMARKKAPFNIWYRRGEGVEESLREERRDAFFWRIYLSILCTTSSHRHRCRRRARQTCRRQCPWPGPAHRRGSGTCASCRAAGLDTTWGWGRRGWDNSWAVWSTVSGSRQSPLDSAFWKWKKFLQTCF